MHTEVPSVRDFENLVMRLDQMAARVDDLEDELRKKCDHLEVEAIVADELKRAGVQK
jgi:hypothetical protein